MNKKEGSLMTLTSDLIYIQEMFKNLCVFTLSMGKIVV